MHYVSYSIFVQEVEEFCGAQVVTHHKQPEKLLKLLIVSFITTSSLLAYIVTLEKRYEKNVHFSSSSGS